MSENECVWKKNLQEKILATQKYISSECYQELELKGSIFLKK